MFLYQRGGLANTQVWALW